MKDSQITYLIRTRDEKGISMLYDKYAKALFGVIERILHNSALSEEVLSQTMLKAWSKIDSFDIEKSSLFTWLMAIARHSAIDKRRLKSFENNQKTDSISSSVYEIEATNTPSNSDVNRVIGLLDEKYRTILNKIYLEGYTQSEAAELLGIPLGTVKTRARTAIQILREELKDEKNLFYGIFLLIIILTLIG